MSFRARKGLTLNNDEQGYIYFACKNYHKQPESIKKKIDNLCVSIAPQSARALKQYLITHDSATAISIRYFVSERTLQYWVNEFYRRW